ncbi:hypothetical protein LV716_04985 [Flagellimonas sp. HMM57]|uniref:hypothetical protein n=1 Tax=unclassified Flagellimonas TaxID=2644544 RepID=UPI0013D03AB4|nr:MULTISPECIES: hypothetical protein [unclassified Flagellimonas]UII77146.1 hypothetical protein LV716_04985 [Flagellimonas sp. HMM57]
MASSNESNKFSESFERQVYDALKFYGYNLPESDEEIESYVEMFGNTKIELPDAVGNPDEIYKKFLEENQDEITDEGGDISAIAAQAEEGEDLPDHVKKKIEDSIKYGRRVNQSKNGDTK